MKETILIKLGGSMLSKSDHTLFDFSYFYSLKQLLVALSADYNFVLNVGGGYVTRKYQQLLKEHGEIDTDDLHKVGIATINLNAQIAHGLLNQAAFPRVIKYQEYDDIVERRQVMPAFADSSIMVVGASQPGASSDYNAVRLAIALGIKRVISLKNVAGVFTDNPKTHPFANLISKLSWQEYLQIIGNPTEHVPGASYPVDPLASALADTQKITFQILHGENLGNLNSLIRTGEFTGSTITAASS